MVVAHQYELGFNVVISCHSLQKISLYFINWLSSISWLNFTCEILKGKCNDFLTYYFYCIDMLFNFLILLKMTNYLGRYAAPKLHFLHPAILFPF